MAKRKQREVSMHEIREELELEWAISDRLKADRHPTRTVDGDDEWGGFEEE